MKPELDPQVLTTHFLLFIEVSATLAFALSGVLEGARKKLDAVGVCAVAFLAAFGGGTVRDLLLDTRPFFWVQYVELLWAVFVLSVAAMIFMRQKHFKATERIILWPDALGLGLFAAAGVFQATQAGLPALPAVLIGVITASLGGVLRDIVVNEIPKAFMDHRPYAICAFLGCWVYLGLQWLGFPDTINLLGCLGTTFGLRVLAVWRDVSLPSWKN